MPQTNMDSDKIKTKHRRLAKLRQIMAATSVSLLGLATGSSFGWTSPMAPLLMSDQSPIPEKMDLHNIAWLGSITYAGAFVCCFFWGSLVDRLGRKTSAVLLAIPYIISWFMVIFADSFLWLLAARFVQGIGNTGTYISVPVFIAEVAQDDLRGFLGTFYTVALSLGAFFAFAVGSYFSYYVLALGCLAIPCVFLLTFTWMPESPMFLWSHGKKEEAKESLSWYRGGDEAETKDTLSNYRLLPKGIKKPSLRSLFATRGTIKALKLGLMLMAALEGGGFFVILTFTVHIFQTSGSSLSPYEAANLLALLRIVFCLICSVLSDRLGRRFLVINSQIIMALSLTMLATYLAASAYQLTNPNLGWVPILALYVYTAAFQLGLGALTFVILSEIFPPDIRGLALSKLCMFDCLVGFAAVKLYPYMVYFLQPHGTYFFYSLLCLLFGIYFHFYLPETKKISQTLIIDLLNGGEDAIYVNSGEVVPLNLGGRSTIICYS